MSEFQFSMLTVTLFSLTVLVGYLLWRNHELQLQITEIQKDLHDLKMRKRRK